MLDALAAPRQPQLRAALGPELDDQLARLMTERALGWARRAGDGREPLCAADTTGLRPLIGGHEGPLLLVAADVPGLSGHHLTAAREDLAAGVLLTSAPSGDGTPFLVGLAGADPELLALVGAPFDTVVAAVTARGGGLGMLRAERRLASVADALALRADPMAPLELRALLGVLG